MTFRTFFIDCLNLLVVTSFVCGVVLLAVGVA